MQNLNYNQISAYLRRLGISEVESPSKDFLFELHKAHVEKVP
jgi:N-hydroxyarylamine O-acetyltransferase